MRARCIPLRTASLRQVFYLIILHSFNMLPVNNNISVTHLGHVLHCSLDDGPDIKRATLEMCKKANVVLSTFSA